MLQKQLFIPKRKKFLIISNYPNKIKKAIINAKSPIASVKAKPKIVKPKSCCLNDGLRAKELTNAAKTIPIPAPTPANPIVAKPAPICFALCNIV